jgi:multicomponent Na+:H+ antiporter subunit E
MIGRLQIIFSLMLVYLALAHQPGEKFLPNLVFGFLIAMCVSLFIPARRQPVDLRRGLISLIWLLRYALLVVADMFKSAYNVARIVLDPKLPIRPGIVAIDSGCQSELATALSAHAITLTPGEMVVAMDERGIMYIHTLEIDRSDEYAEEAQSLRRNLLSKIVV